MMSSIGERDGTVQGYPHLAGPDDGALDNLIAVGVGDMNDVAERALIVGTALRRQHLRAQVMHAGAFGIDRRRFTERLERFGVAFFLLINLRQAEPRRSQTAIKLYRFGKICLGIMIFARRARKQPQLVVVKRHIRLSPLCR